jgi:cyclase
MLRERVAENVYVFTSELYAQVNAGAAIGPDWAVLIDTLPYPEETREIREFIEGRLGSRVRYIVIAHARCRTLMDTVARARLEAARPESPDLAGVELVLPSMVFAEGGLTLRLGRRTLELIPLPGHSADGIGVLFAEDHVLFSGDAMMPMPYLVDGDADEMINSLRRIPKLKLENLVQGHGEIILRGEIQNAVRSNVNYLTTIQRHASRARRRKNPESALADLSVEECGKPRIALGGLAPELHRQNLATLVLRDEEP